jgi:hypothetical protein
MTPQEAFKFGFLLRCAQEGLSPDQTRDRMAKFASRAKVALSMPFEGTLNNLAGAAKNVALSVPALATRGTLASVALGGLGGVAGGYALSSAMDDAVDPNEARDEELIAEYRRAIQDLTRRHQMAHAA